jgi:hypothetical protein
MGDVRWAMRMRRERDIECDDGYVYGQWRTVSNLQ